MLVLVWALLEGRFVGLLDVMEQSVVEASNTDLKSDSGTLVGRI